MEYTQDYYDLLQQFLDFYRGYTNAVFVLGDTHLGIRGINLELDDSFSQTTISDLVNNSIIEPVKTREDTSYSLTNNGMDLVIRLVKYGFLN
ncbi:MAG: hypothetical protein AABY14_02100 [Nanoarchaeota archaeon]